VRQGFSAHGFSFPTGGACPSRQLFPLSLKPGGSGDSGCGLQGNRVLPGGRSEATAGGGSALRAGVARHPFFSFRFVFFRDLDIGDSLPDGAADAARSGPGRSFVQEWKGGGFAAPEKTALGAPEGCGLGREVLGARERPCPSSWMGAGLLRELGDRGKPSVCGKRRMPVG
jgi:hypothetical protein